MSFYVEYFNENGQELLGSGGTRFLHLKTIKGAITHIHKFKNRVPRASYFKLYRYHKGNELGNMGNPIYQGKLR